MNEMEKLKKNQKKKKKNENENENENENRTKEKEEKDTNNAGFINEYKLRIVKELPVKDVLGSTKLISASCKSFDLGCVEKE